MLTLAERNARILARKIGKEKAVRFRQYKGGHIGKSPWNIKAYGRFHVSGRPDDYGEDFNTWREALEWVKGQD